MKNIAKFIMITSSVLLLNANERKVMDIDEFTKEIKAIQEVTKDPTIENSKEISKLQETLQLDDLKGRAKQEEVVKLNIDNLITNVQSEIKKIENDIAATSFISSKSGFSMGKDKYKKVALEDIEFAYNKIIELRKELNIFKDNLETLKELKLNDTKLLHNSSIDSILQNFKNSNNKNMMNFSSPQQFSNLSNNQKRKTYITVKIGDKIFGSTVSEISDFGIRIK